jgi:hypothetical protein
VTHVTLLHCPRLSQYDCCLPFPCIHAQTMQHCQHPHTASNLSNLTWAGQQSATLCLWCSRMKTTNNNVHNLLYYHVTALCHCRMVLNAQHENKVSKLFSNHVSSRASNVQLDFRRLIATCTSNPFPLQHIAYRAETTPAKMRSEQQGLHPWKLLDTL